jgi:hypothetical protein
MLNIYKMLYQYIVLNVVISEKIIHIVLARG